MKLLVNGRAGYRVVFRDLVIVTVGVLVAPAVGQPSIIDNGYRIALAQTSRGDGIRFSNSVGCSSALMSTVESDCTAAIDNALVLPGSESGS